MKSIRVLVIDDSAFMRKVIKDMLESDQRIQVIATARNGEDGIRKIKKLSPNVVTLDIHMPVMDGITALQYIMGECPVPVVMLSSATAEGADKTLQAISNGAVDFITKPSGSLSIENGQITKEIISKVIAASGVSIAEKPEETKIQSTDIPVQNRKQTYSRTIVTIGTSTGGPRALQQVIPCLPADFSAPILIVQHMPPGFTKSLAERLNSMSAVHVKEAVHGEVLEDGTAYIAPGNYHMHVKKRGIAMVVELSQKEPVNGHRPSVDVLFESAGDLDQTNKIAVILTGMGSDGSNGIKRMKTIDPSTITIAESEKTAVIYGMPKSAVKTNCVNHIVALNQVADTLENLVNV
ncbi:chemotaxis response regulator protein-glutamate methylesterase [Oceanobacillus picturae]|uniref:Protein-glutamate methylesterase/protein-glutamine glutaminase n=1 Tax=Oceanobacillus picturae TaxID=171693 RepID=A0A0U9H7G4_9BACI|nr:chemotaxis response regulator protein-glutamate methylesterase [Oceanobacillus picturae]GAQ16116.1 chemotaxis response regulator protein-glutamate methylesterase [Oceanobacillus picturae]